ncbi:alpha/beta hydrolase [Bordetella sp. 15P40C-2]|uniref:alpha/beta hydrolase n=1 Tax=Bordetella sp. 15P40C-2 TaxID=2572246 RepID=UPI0013274AAA|nr:alpha/beta hydrolase-fold protein [Bordetella sp. 15P40C-2]MVW72002.1 prolyl oligopeptidase family serine peptidase [Bordetella sp. 15P40C-2]
MIRLSILSLCSVLGAASVYAQTPVAEPAPGMQLVGETVMDRPSSWYQFERHMLDSADGKRHYRIDISIPRAPAPAGGYPVLYMLDGNAAMATLQDDDLAKLANSGHPPVLVAIGYDVPTRNDVVSRAFDYTPPTYENGQRVHQEDDRGRAGGGADIFLDYIQSVIQPLVKSRTAVNSRKEMLWGHSYGGLFTLHTLFTRPAAFARYVAGDPSAWWNDGVLVREWQAFDAKQAAGKAVAVFVGTKPRDPNRPMPNLPRAKPGQAPIENPRAIIGDMAESLRQGGANVTYETFPQYGHGEMIRVSLERALDIAIQP